MFLQFGQYITQFFADIWRIFQVNLPYLGLTFGDIIIGGFVIMLSIRIFKSFISLPSVSASRRTGKGKPYRRKNNVTDTDN